MATQSATLPSFREALGVWTKIGLLSFGGPTAQIALMHRTLVDERKWLDESTFLGALSFCMLLPGPEAMQLATYAGWRFHGVKGGLAAGSLFVGPGAIVVLTLAMIYAAFGSVPAVAAVFFGIKSAVLVIVIEALLRIAKRALKLPEHWVLAALAFAGIFLLALPFPVIIVAAAAFGYVRAQPASGPQVNVKADVPAAQSLRTALTWSAIWVVPLLLVRTLLGPEHVLTQLGWFFSKLSVVTFGGAYAVLTYMAQEVVVGRHWITPGAMMDGLGLAETTPGPLILVTEFVGYLAAYQGASPPSIGLGIVGAIVTLWATFVPCFLWIFVGGPYLEWIIGQPRLRGALAAITAAVVGVILNLSIWFALHVFFANVTTVTAGPLHLLLPEAASFNWRVLALAMLSGYLLLICHWSILYVLAVAAAGSALLAVAGL